MKKLNLRAPKGFDYTKEAESIPPRIRFYCVSEGPTEESYFWGIRNNRAELNIKNNVYIEVIEKQEGQETLSHPMQLVSACLVQMGHRDPEGKEIPEKDWKEHCKWENFDPEVDQVCVIFDRDYRGLEEKLEEIFALCEKHGIKIVISNPNFELWLLMHFPDIKQYPSEQLLRNKKNLRHQIFPEASKEKKYLEILVSRQAEGYTKGSKIKFEKFLPRIEMAVSQAKLYCEDIKRLREELGTAMGSLIEEIRSE